MYVYVYRLDVDYTVYSDNRYVILVGDETTNIRRFCIDGGGGGGGGK